MCFPQYIRWHTGIDAVYLPSWCGEDDSSYGEASVRDQPWFGSRIYPKYTPIRGEFVVLRQGPEDAPSQLGQFFSGLASSRKDVDFIQVTGARSLASQLEDSIIFYRALIVIPDDVRLCPARRALVLTSSSVYSYCPRRSRSCLSPPCIA